MNLITYVIFAVACFLLATINAFLNDREKTSGMVFCIVTPLAFLLFAIVCGNLSTTYNSLYLTITLAIAFYLAIEGCLYKNTTGVVLRGILSISSLTMLICGSISLAPFTIFGLVGGFLFGAGFGFTVFMMGNHIDMTKKVISFVEFLFSGAILGCSISSVIASTHTISAILYLIGAILMFIRYILRAYFEHASVFRVITKIIFGLAMISIISAIYFF